MEKGQNHKKKITKAGRFVISKSSTRSRKADGFTEMVVYKTETTKGKFTSKTRHEKVKNQ